MELPKYLRQDLVQEIKSVAKNMGKTQDPLEKVYYYSAAYAQALRILNLKYSPELSFIQFVLSGSYNQISHRVAQMSKKEDKPISIPENLFDKLQHELEMLGEKIEMDKPVYAELENIVNLSYVTTGNGFYLYLTGKISPIE